MAFQIDSSNISFPRPAPAGSAFRLNYEVTNLGPDDSGHQDHVQVWGSDGSQPVNNMENAPPSVAGGLYGVFVDIPPLNAGYYDVSVTLPDGTGAGSTIIVE
jgi:hypothetical protein